MLRRGRILALPRSCARILLLGASEAAARCGEVERPQELDHDEAQNEHAAWSVVNEDEREGDEDRGPVSERDTGAHPAIGECRTQKLARPEEEKGRQ